MKYLLNIDVYSIGHLYVLDHSRAFLVVVPAVNVICSYDTEVLSISNNPTLYTNYFKLGNKLRELNFLWGYCCRCGPSSSVGIATDYGLDVPGFESWWGARFSAPVQTGPGVHSASCTMGTGSFPGVKSGRVVTLTPHPLLVPWS
jgi:hypothetical protein